MRPIPPEKIRKLPRMSGIVPTFVETDEAPMFTGYINPLKETVSATMGAYDEEGIIEFS